MGGRSDYERKFRRAGLPSFVDGAGQRPLVRRALGIGWILLWALAHGVSTVARSLALLVRTLPIIAAFSLVIFFDEQWWQVLAHLSGAKLVLLTVTVIGAGVGFMLASLTKQIDGVESLATGDYALDHSQRRNVGFVIFTAQSIHVFVLTFVIWLLLVGLGAFAVPADMQANWSGLGATSVHALFGIDPQSGLTDTLVVVTLGVALLSGLYLAITATTDAEYRERSRGEIADRVGDVSAAHAEYLALLAAEKRSDS